MIGLFSIISFLLVIYTYSTYDCIIFYWAYALYPPGGSGVLCPPPCVTYWIPPVLTLVSSVYLLLAIGFVYIPVPVKVVCTGMAKAFGVEWGRCMVIGYLGPLTWRGWARRRIPTVIPWFFFLDSLPTVFLEKSGFITVMTFWYVHTLSMTEFLWIVPVFPQVVQVPLYWDFM